MMSTGASSSTAYKPRCGVIGTGEEGSALIYKLTKHGLEVRMANAGDSECLSELASKTGAYAVATEDVVRDVDIVFLCIPMKAIPELPKQMFAKCPEKTIVVDCCNYYPSRDGSIPEIEQGMPESLWVKKEIGHDVIKAFNSILAGALKDCGRPHDSGMRIALPISGDDEKAKECVSNLMNELGFDVCDCGPLSHSWKQQPGSPIYCTNLPKEELCNAMAKVSKEELPKMRDRAYHKMIHAGKELDWQSLVNLLRETYNPSMSKEMQQQQGMTTATREPIST